MMRKFPYERWNRVTGKSFADAAISGLHMNMRQYVTTTSTRFFALSAGAALSIVCRHPSGLSGKSRTFFGSKHKRDDSSTRNTADTLCNFAMTSKPQRRLNHILSELTPMPPFVGTLKLGDITYEVPASFYPPRLPHSKELLDIQDPVNRDNLYFMLQKYLLGQDLFLVSQPGPYARRLALTFARYELCGLDCVGKG